MELRLELELELEMEIEQELEQRFRIQTKIGIGNEMDVELDRRRLNGSLLWCSEEDASGINLIQMSVA